MASQQFFHVWIDFKTKKKTSERPFVGSHLFLSLKDNENKNSSVCFLKQRGLVSIESLLDIAE